MSKFFKVLQTLAVWIFFIQLGAFFLIGLFLSAAQFGSLLVLLFIVTSVVAFKKYYGTNAFDWENK